MLRLEFNSIQRINQIKSFISADKKNIYVFNFYKSQYVKYYFPQQADSIAWSCFS